MQFKKQINSLELYFIYLFIFISVVFLLVLDDKTFSYASANVNTAKGLESSRIVEILENDKEEKEVSVSSIEEIKNSDNKNVEFTGTLTGYGPDCPGCSGNLACYPYKNVLNNNIYYSNEEYQNIRILAADSSIPCGSIVKVSNYLNEDFIGIVLDRGSAVKGLTMDLLYSSEKTVPVGRQYNIKFKIIRWGY